MPETYRINKAHTATTHFKDQYEPSYYNNAAIKKFSSEQAAKLYVSLNKSKQPIFTANGVDYFYNDYYFRVFKDFTYSANVALEAPDEDHLANCIVFKTIEQVLDYIFLNQPKLVSIKDIKDALALGESVLTEKLSALFKSKTM